MKTRKRLSSGMHVNPDGVDPLFEFDVPRLFVDLTRPPQYAVPVKTTTASKEGAAVRVLAGHAVVAHVYAHDPWFDLVHRDHSRPTEESLALSQDEMQSRLESHGPTQRHERLETDGEKENRDVRATVGASASALRRKRRNVAYEPQEAEPVGRMKATIRSISAHEVTAVKTTTVRRNQSFGGRKTPLGTKQPTEASTLITPTTKKLAVSSSGPGVNSLPRKRPMSERAMDPLTRSQSTPVGAVSARKPTVSGTASTSAAKDLQDLQALLAKHNKKFRSNHTYEPPQHSVRDVRLWEQHSRKSYYKLSLEERTRANEEIAELVRARHVS
ncbi:hypothetical protein Poli38472_011597 [Pythium oligandrum]|uniref:Uncharacterized protein n=1 Tax=Pythium oligandrum TaxID=41045 RepID=A0A8K1CJQ1_PYTOL|nr:hypothetical protein Poli38472_011597 [Pythium oligandrum]|eukprot:TMW64717.1 hypothetical protein Poli38472_011597 [Pythium oligandrum]